jgi:hypothetical protein
MRPTRRDRNALKHTVEKPPWWATSAVPYRFFWLLPSGAAVAAGAASDRFGVPLVVALVCAEAPALGLEAWWRHKRPLA